MTFDENEADREPPKLGGFFIADCRLPISNFGPAIRHLNKSEIGNRKLAIRWTR
jgi:hypothetical protein